MYLPREFSWQYSENDVVIFQLTAQSRGDYKFGFMQVMWAALVSTQMGQWDYQRDIVNILDCRPLNGKKNKTRK